MMLSDDDLTSSPTTELLHPPSVFISYAHEDDDHEAQVRALWIFLRANGINASLDLPATARRQDWALWMLQHVRTAQFVLVIASPEYRRRGDGETGPDEGRGVQWEAALIREEMYANRHAALRKIVPVMLPGRSTADLPRWLGPTTTSHYYIDDFTIAGAEGLLRLLTEQPREVQPPLGPSPLLPSRRVVANAVRPPSAGNVPQSRPSAMPRDAPLMIAPIYRLFLHFFDPHFLDEIARGRNHDLVAMEARRATRAAILAAETVFVPAASYIESSLCAETINEYRGLFDTGQIVLVGGEANMVDFATAKLLQYEPGSDRFRRYEAVLSSSAVTPPFRSRTRSATRDITSAWLRRLDDLSDLLEGLPTADFTNFESTWADVPAWLGDRAFTPEYVMRGLFDPAPTSGPELIVARRAGSQVNSEYFKSYTAELSSGLVTDLTYLHSPHTGSSQSVDLPFRFLFREFASRGVLELVLGARPERLVEMRHHHDIAAAIVCSLATPAVPGSRETTLTVSDPPSSAVTPMRAEQPPSRLTS